MLCRLADERLLRSIIEPGQHLDVALQVLLTYADVC
jgi:hypothetical protein